MRDKNPKANAQLMLLACATVDSLTTPRLCCNYHRALTFLCMAEVAKAKLPPTEINHLDTDLQAFLDLAGPHL